MKVFHGIVEIAGQMGILCGALKRENHIAVGYNTFHSYLGYRDHLINTDAFCLQGMFKQFLNFFDIFHYHYGVPMWPDFRDLKEITNRGKKLIMHHWGNDIRFHDMAKTNNPHVYTGDSPPNAKIHETLTKITKYTSVAIVQDHEVLPYAEKYYEKVFVLPLAIDLSRFQPRYPDITKKRLLVVHAPTNPLFKGTAQIEAALEELRTTYDFDYKRIEKMSHTQVAEIYAEADLIIDQVLCGSHGLLAVESMALGKPVIAFIRPDLVERFPSDLPIVNANPTNLVEKIRMMLEDPLERNHKGKQGRLYVEEYHSREKVVKELLAIYAQLL